MKLKLKTWKKFHIYKDFNLIEAQMSKNASQFNIFEITTALKNRTYKLSEAHSKFDMMT